VRGESAKRVRVLTAFGPVVASATLTKDKVVGSEEVTEGTGSDGIHGTWFEIDEDGTRNVLVRADFVVVDRDALELKIVCTHIGTFSVDAVFV
jgi:hypothetical protein